MQYHFNQAGVVHDPDDDGMDFDTIAEARIEAVRYAGEVLRDHPTLIWAGEDFRIEVTDDAGLQLFTVIVIGVDSPSTQAR